MSNEKEEKGSRADRDPVVFMALDAALAVISALLLPFGRLVSFYTKAPVVTIVFGSIALGGVCGAFILWMLSFIKMHRAYRLTGESEKEEAARTRLVNAGISLCGIGAIVIAVSAAAMNALFCR